MQPHTVDIEAAKEILPALLEEALRGDEVVITRGEQPAVRLVAHNWTEPRPRRQAGSARGQIWMSEDLDEPLDEFAV